jgi:hypothetical protein
MKPLILSLIVLNLVACGKPEQMTLNTTSPSCKSHPNLGIWEDYQTGDILTLKEDCSGTSTICESEFLFSKPNGNNFTIRVTKTNDRQGCLPLGDTVCTAIVYPPGQPEPDRTDTRLAYTCDDGQNVLIYHKK